MENKSLGTGNPDLPGIVSSGPVYVYVERERDRGEGGKYNYVRGFFAGAYKLATMIS